jgi:hypothetical protein
VTEIPLGSTDNSQEPPAKNAAAKIKRADFIDYIDPQTGMVQQSVPFPKGWRYDDNPTDQLLLIGPN